MCILFIYREPKASSGSYRLILVSNRDEYYARPASHAHLWKDYPGCVGGKDMEPGREGGTWLALNYKSGRVGVILNLNGVPKSPDAKGRGFLIREYLMSSKSAITHANDLHKYNQETQSYNPYILVMVDLRSSDVCYLDSVLNFPGPTVVTDKILGFGNSGMERPYKKVLAGKEKFEKIVANASTSKQELLIDDLMAFLKQEDRHLPDEELEKRSPQAFNELSAIFVRHETAKYGTRTHSIVLVDHSHGVTFIEETLNSDGTWTRQIFINNLE